MSTEGSENTWQGRDADAKEYLNDHKIVELFNNLTSQLIFNRPDEPKKHMIEILEKLQKSRATKLDFPCLFDDTNIQSIYGMLDPTGRGFITLQQYMEALTTLGIKDFPEVPEGTEDEKITFDIFLREARLGLTQVSSTFQS
ncbi:EF-hand calcium-binding domain-containing protein 10-like [Mytilus trossulus]|uniref:EF-hand calcium-binding domain-containing protein 10-like n=1 Tax=Mytilus trossulus TaxID=6551 RepID=UPI00300741B0